MKKLLAALIVFVLATAVVWAAGQQPMSQSNAVVIASDQTSFPVTVAAGTANIGDVDVLTIAAGNTNIGDVDVASSIPGTGATNLGKAEDAPAGTTETGVAALAKQQATPADEATDLDYAFLQMDDGALWTRSLVERGSTVDSTITRVAANTAYAAGDAISDSTSAPTAGGFTFTNACRVSGGSGVITDIIITDSDDATTKLQASVFIYDQAVTNINDDTAFAVTDAEAKTMVLRLPVAILVDDGNQGAIQVNNVQAAYTCVGTANLRWLLRADNAYDAAANSGTITVRLKIKWTS